MAMLDFLKKKDSDVSGAQTPPAQAPGSTQTVVQSSQTVVPQPQSYNGIGNPPSGQSYNGIGTPPAPQVPEITTQSVQAVPAAPVAPSAPVAPATPATTDTPATTTQTDQPPATTTAPATQSDAPKDATTPAQTTDVQKPADPNKTANPGNTDPTAQTQEQDAAKDKSAQLDLMTHLTQRSNRVFVTAQQKAKEFGSDLIDSEHLLHGLLADPEVYKLFVDQKIQPQIIEQELDKLYQKGTSTKQPQPSPRLKKILENSLVVARKIGYEFISPEHILVSLYDEGEGIGARTLAKLGLKKEDLNKKIVGKKEGIEGKESGEKQSTSVLQQYTRDLTELAAQGQLDPVVERSDVIERVIHITSRRSKNNPALVGEAGVGKTAIVEGLAQKIVSKEVPESLLGKKIYQLDLMSIIAGASHRGEFEERMKKLIEEISNSKGQIILFIDEIHNLVGAGAGGEGALDASNFLKPALARGELQVIGATTLTEYRKYIEKDPALERRFQPVLVPEPTEEAAVKMVKALRDKYEAFHKVKIPDDAIDAAVKLSKRYVGDRFLPDKAVDLIDEAGAAVRLPLISLPEKIRSLEERLKQLEQEYQEAEKIGNKVQVNILKPKVDDLKAKLTEDQEEYNTKKAQTTSSVTEQIIKDVIARWTGIPVAKITSSELEKLKKLEDIIHQRLINQEHAVTPVAESIRRGRAGLKSTDRPIGSFVFLGPTGVGKTELSKTLAEVLFGQEEAMIRFDMTEYMEKHEVAKLLGAPPGYVGYEEGGKLTEAVRRRPYSVVLFDEVEKAHPDIFNILLQILDDGRLTDNRGHVVSFKNTVVITTSNIGTKMIQDDILASGKTDIEEPTAISTYAFSPRGRQILTIMGKVFERESPTGQWNNKMLIDYFSGQSVQANQTNQQPAVPADPTQADQPPAPAKPAQPAEFPGKEFDTHTMSPKGAEYISVGDQMLWRTSTTAKVWNSMNLIQYFNKNVVINALPDAPEQQLPTARLKTHTFSPDESEVVSFRDRYWRRKDGDTNWETGELKDYFTGHQLDNNTVAPNGNLSIAQSDTQKAGAPQAGANQTAQNQNNQKVTQTDQKGKAELKGQDPLTTQTNDTKQPQPAQSKLDKPEESTQPSQQTEPAAFPTNYWDIHGFTSDGGEYIIVGEQVWSRKPQTTLWKMQSISDYFGKDFPLDQELSEKKKIEDELSKNQYEKTKAKVMDELRKFFRPELINRFDEVIIFEPLKYHHMLLIAELQLKGVKKMLEDQNMGFAWTHAAKKEIVRQGFDPIYGARPLRRTIQKLVENPLSSLIIEKKLEENDMVRVDFDGAELIFTIDKVKFVPESEAAKSKPVIKKYKCIQSGHEFETEVKEGATVICPINAQEKVEEVKSEPIIKPDGTSLKTDETQPKTAQKNADPNAKQSTSAVPDQKQNTSTSTQEPKQKKSEKKAGQADQSPAQNKPTDTVIPTPPVNPQGGVDKDLQGVQNILENKLGQQNQPVTPQVA